MFSFEQCIGGFFLTNLTLEEERMKKYLAGTIILLVGLLMLSTSILLAQVPCTADFDCDQDVDATDVDGFLNQFGRSPFFDPCPDCYDSPCPCTPQGGNCLYGMIDCGTKCVDPDTDREYCGANQECIGGTVCGAGEICDGGVCFLNCPPGLTNCTGSCVDTTTDESNCGDCGVPCDSGKVCWGGNCELFCSDNYAPIPKTGQTTSYIPGDDGELLKGVVWPNPRFTDNSDGTITDNLTNLIWLKDANCFGQRTWNNAMSDSNGLADGSCGLTDGSSAGDWRLPNSNELDSLVHKEYYNPVVPNTAGTGQWLEGDPFNNVQSYYYWSSTTRASDSDFAWFVYMGNGGEGFNDKSVGGSVWPVRGGQ
jgi:hypothetical protein